MNESPDLVTLLYRADWTRLSLAAEVHGTVDHDLAGLKSASRRGSGRLFGPSVVWPGTQPRQRPAGDSWEVATGRQGTESSRSALLVAPGRRYRHQGDGFLRGSDGTVSWHGPEEGDGDGRAEAVSAEPGPPLRALLRPSWLLTDFTLEAGEPVTAGGRPGIPVVATPRPSLWDARPATQPPAPADRIEVIVDAELGILLRHEEIFGGKSLSLTELVNVSLDPPGASDYALFQPPPGAETARSSAPPGGTGEAFDKLTARLLTGGLGVLLRTVTNRSGEVTSDWPDATMPADDAGSPGTAPVSDEVVHLLHASAQAWAPGIQATVHEWVDPIAMFGPSPDQAGPPGFLGLGALADAAQRRAPVGHLVSGLRLGGPGRYRLVVKGKGELPVTNVCDGEKWWTITADTVTVRPAAPLLTDIANMFDGCWLLEARLAGGAETMVDGRRGYRLAVSSDDPRQRGPFWPEEVVVDADLGIVLRVISRGERTARWRELRDVAAYSGDFDPHLAPGTKVTEEAPAPAPRPEGANPYVALAGSLAGQAAKEARSAIEGVLGFIRGDSH